jgi:hypothetical protein
MIAASIVMGRALAPVEQAVGQWKQFVSARQSHKRLKVLFESISEDKDRMELPAPAGKIVVEKLVAFRPGTREAMLKNVSSTSSLARFWLLLGPVGQENPLLFDIWLVPFSRLAVACAWTVPKLIIGMRSSSAGISDTCPKMFSFLLARSVKISLDSKRVQMTRISLQQQQCLALMI